MKQYRATLTVLAGVVLTAALSGWVYTRNSLFRLSEVVVKTESPDLARSVRQQFVGLLGKRLTSISLSSAESSLRKIPRVKRAVLHKRWPSRLVIVVEERRPVAMAFMGQKLWGVDEHGAKIDILREPETVPLLKGFTRGDALEPKDSELLARVCEWLASLGDLDQVNEIEWRKDRGLTVRGGDGEFEVDLGFKNFDAAWKRAELALTIARSKNLTVGMLDASYERRVVVRLKSKLQNFENGLNSRELVRRMENLSATALGGPLR